MVNQYGEPWKKAGIEGISDHIGMMHTTHDAFLHADARNRAVNCVNLLAGIPDEELPNVLKAYHTYLANIGEYDKAVILLDNLNHLKG